MLILTELATRVAMQLYAAVSEKLTLPTEDGKWINGMIASESEELTLSAKQVSADNWSITLSSKDQGIDLLYYIPRQYWPEHMQPEENTTHRILMLQTDPLNSCTGKLNFAYHVYHPAYAGALTHIYDCAECGSRITHCPEQPDKAFEQTLQPLV